MKALGILTLREARNQAWLVGTLGVLGCLLVLAFHAGGPTWSATAWTFYRLGLVGCLTLAAAGILITESFTAESENDQGERLRSLPLEAGPLVLSKLLWIALACVGLGTAWRLAEGAGVNAFGSVWEGKTFPVRLYREHFPLSLYAPLWLLWAVALSTLLRRWLYAACAVTLLVVGSILAWPWPLAQPAVIPGRWIYALLLALPAALTLRETSPGWRLPRESVSTALRVLGLCGATLGLTGFIQVQGQDWVLRPTPRDASYSGRWLSQDGSVLCVQPRSSYVRIDGKTDSVHGSWLLDSRTGTILQDGWPWTHFQLHRTHGVEEILAYHPDRKPEKLWIVDPRSGSEAYLATNAMWLLANSRWTARSTGHGTLAVRIPWMDFEAEFPWQGRWHQGREPGVVFAWSGNTLERHELLEGTRRALAELPFDAGDPPARTLRRSPCGDYLTVASATGPTRCLDAHTGKSIATIPGGWETSWTGGPRPFAVARPVETREDGNRWYVGLDSLWIGPQGATPIQLPAGGDVVSSESKRIFLVHDEGILELGEDGLAIRRLQPTN